MFNLFDERGDLRGSAVAKLVGLVVVVIIAVIALFRSFRTIDAEHVAVKVTFGKVSDEPCYGLSMKLPFFADFVKLDKTTQRIEANDGTYTSDIQSADIQYVFTYKIVDANAPKLYLSTGRAYEEKLIIPILQSVIKDVIGKWTAQELVSNRDKAATEIYDKLVQELNPDFFTEVSFKMANIDYSDAFENGIEAKVLAEQKAQEAKNKTLQIEEEARQKEIAAQGDANAAIAKANGDAAAVKIKSEADADAMRKISSEVSRNPKILEYMALEAQIEMAKSASGWKTVVMDGAGTLLNIPGGE